MTDLTRLLIAALVSSMGAGCALAVALAYPMGWIMCSTLLYIRYRGSKLVRETGI